MSENLKLGQIITNDQARDAIHIAVAPMQAAEKLSPGQHVAVIGTEAWASAGTPVGVVDPYLKADVKKGQRFWLFLYPGSISSLRHEWTHPAFVADAGKTESEMWLRAFADRLFSYDPDYGSRFDVLIANAENGGFGTDIEYGEDCEPNDEFWMHFERYTGRKVLHRPSYFRCAC